MIGNEDISKIIDDCKAMNHNVKVGDIAYVFLLRTFKDKEVVFKALFGTTFSDNDIDVYDKSPKTKFLKKYIKSNYEDKEVPKNSNKKIKDISFEENKEALVKRLGDLESLAESGELDAKDALKLEVDIRTRLNDKFAVSEKQDEQRIIVEKKYNDICVCGREIYRPTRDDIIEDLEKEYDLVPKNINKDNEREN